jgi:hypothetical protein
VEGGVTRLLCRVRKEGGVEKDERNERIGDQARDGSEEVSIQLRRLRRWIGCKFRMLLFIGNSETSGMRILLGTTVV